MHWEIPGDEQIQGRQSLHKGSFALRAIGLAMKHPGDLSNSISACPFSKHWHTVEHKKAHGLLLNIPGCAIVWLKPVSDIQCTGEKLKQKSLKSPSLQPATLLYSQWAPIERALLRTEKMYAMSLTIIAKAGCSKRRMP